MSGISNVYLDDAKYGDQILLHDVYLMMGLRHRLTVRTYPCVLDKELLLHTDSPLDVRAEGMDVLVDLEGEKEERVVRLEIEAKDRSFKEWYSLHLFPRVTREDLIGRYRCQRNKDQFLVLEKEGAELELADLVDGLPLFRSVSWSLDPYSLRIALSFQKYVAPEGVTYSLQPYFRYNPVRKTVEGALCLEAVDESGLTDDAYLLGEGDEDGIIGYDLFSRLP